ARLVTWFAAGPVGLDFRVADGAEAHLAADHASRLAPTTDQRHGCQHLMTAPRQSPQHGARLGEIRRLAKNAPIQHDSGIGAQHYRIGRLAQGTQTGTRFFPSQTFYIGSWRLVWQRIFIYRGDLRDAWHSNLGQQFT